MLMGRIFAVLICVFIMCAGMAFAYDEAIVGQAERAAETFRSDLALIEKELQLPTVTDEQLTGHRGRLEDIRASALSQAAELAKPLDEVKQQIGLLGPAPTEGSVEVPGVAEQRAALTKTLDRLQGASAQLDLVSVTAEQLTGRASALQRNLFVTRIFEGGRSIVNPQLWLDTGRGLGQMVTRLAALFANWWADASGHANFAGLALIPLFLGFFAGIYLLARGRIRQWTRSHLYANRTPGDIERLWRVVSGVITTFAVLFVLILPVYLALKIGGFITPRFELVLDAAIDVVLVTAIYWAIALRVMAPGKPAWRIVDVDETAAARLPVLAGLAAFTAAATRSMGEIADSLYLPVSYTIGQSALSAMFMLLLLALILLTLSKQTGLPNPVPGRQVYFKWLRRLFPVVWLLIGVGVVALLAGYVALASYITQQIFETAVLVIVLFLLHHLSDAAVAASLDPNSGFGRLLRKLTGLGERGIERFGLAFRTIVDLILLAAGLPLLFLLWTFTWIDFRSLVNTAIFGFRVGDILLSPWSVIVVFLILVAGIVLTNQVVRWLDRRVLSYTRVDKGVQDSLRKGASYAGYVVAAVVAFSAAGFNFSNLAIVAGALGVGIGFGLQSIVNNFVSGLILLAERPVRVGDWVALDAGEGIVKRINVRSTEIDTFDSCSIIVPNSSLITGAVRNWTHGDTMGRFSVAVSVAYGSAVSLVNHVLAEVVRAHPKVLTFPEPQVQLTNFGLYGLDFEIKAYVAHIFDGAAVASDLRFAILAAFAEKSIAIAQPPALMQLEKKRK